MTNETLKLFFAQRPGISIKPFADNELTMSHRTLLYKITDDKDKLRPITEEQVKDLLPAMRKYGYKNNQDD